MSTMSQDDDTRARHPSRSMRKLRQSVSVEKAPQFGPTHWREPVNLHAFQLIRRPVARAAQQPAGASQVIPITDAAMILMA